MRPEAPTRHASLLSGVRGACPASSLSASLLLQVKLKLVWTHLIMPLIPRIRSGEAAHDGHFSTIDWPEQVDMEAVPGAHLSDEALGPCA